MMARLRTKLRHTLTVQQYNDAMHLLGEGMNLYRLATIGCTTRDVLKSIQYDREAARLEGRREVLERMFGQDYGTFFGLEESLEP
jgi:hypothetical protein